MRMQASSSQAAQLTSAHSRGWTHRDVLLKHLAGQPRGLHVQWEDGLGAVVSKVIPGSVAEHSGLQLDDVLVSVNDSRVTSLEAVALLLKQSGDLRLSICRQAPLPPPPVPTGSLTHGQRAPVARLGPVPPPPDGSASGLLQTPGQSDTSAVLHPCLAEQLGPPPSSSPPVPAQSEANDHGKATLNSGVALPLQATTDQLLSFLLGGKGEGEKRKKIMKKKESMLHDLVARGEKVNGVTLTAAIVEEAITCAQTIVGMKDSAHQSTEETLSSDHQGLFGRALLAKRAQAAGSNVEGAAAHLQETPASLGDSSGVRRAPSEGVQSVLASSPSKVAAEAAEHKGEPALALLSDSRRLRPQASIQADNGPASGASWSGTWTSWKDNGWSDTASWSKSSQWSSV